MNVYLIIRKVDADGTTHTMIVDRDFKVRASKTFESPTKFRVFTNLYSFSSVHPKPEGLRGLLTEHEFNVASVYRATPFDSDTSKKSYNILLDLSIKAYKSFCKR